MRKSIIVIVLFLLSSTLSVLAEESKWLVKKGAFEAVNNDKTHHALSDINIAHDNLYVVDNVMGHRILAFKKNGDRLFIAGGKGKKPGQLFCPLQMSIWNDRIVVKDDNGLSVFSTDGRFVRRIRPFVNVVSFVCLNDKIYVLSGTPDMKSLINVFTMEGKFISEFGEEFLRLDYSLFKHMSPIHVKGMAYEGRLLSDGKSLYYINTKFGKMFVFSLAGRKTAETDVAGLFDDVGEKTLRANEKLFLNEGIDLEKSGGGIPSNGLFLDACLFGEKIYFLTRKAVRSGEHWREEFGILAMDKNTFQSVGSYNIRTDPDERIFALAVEEDKGEPVFYFTVMSGDKPSVVAEYRREK